MMVTAAEGERGVSPRGSSISGPTIQIPQNHPSKEEGQMGQCSSGRPKAPPIRTAINLQLPVQLPVNTCFDLESVLLEFW